MLSSLLSMSGLENIHKRNSNKKDVLSSVSSNTLKTMNSFRTLPIIKSKSFNSSGERQRNEMLSKTENSTTRRRLSWLERRTWSFRRGNKRNAKGMECWPDITIIFSKDANEWDEYLTECFTQTSESHPLTIFHERIDHINFPLGNFETQNFTNSRTVLLILSPDLLDFIDENADVFELTRLLNPKRTVVMLCGVQQQDISRFHRAALASYDQWTCLEAKDQDKEFVVSVIQTILMIIQQNENNSSNKPLFKLTPRKVREGNGKVFVLLDSPISQKQQIDILFDGSNDNHVSVKWKNPYNLYFTIPDEMLRVARVINISLICDNKNFMGTRPIKCETKMSELHSLLASVNSPFEFMCQTLGYPTVSQLDAELSNRFEQKMPNFGSVFVNDLDIIADKKSSESHLPTLLHFAAAYGLRELTTKLLHCPLAVKACQIRNSDNLTPAQMAHHLNHSDIGALLEDFERLCETQKLNILYDCRQQIETTDQQKTNLERNVTEFRYSNSKLSSAHHQLYGLKLYSDLLHIKQREEFSKNQNQNKTSDESKQTNVVSEEYGEQQLSNEIHFQDSTVCDSSDSETACAVDPQTITESIDKSLVKKVNNFESKNNIDMTFKSQETYDLNETQKELIDIIEVFKDGLSFEKFEPLFDNWQKKYCNVIDANETKELHESLTQIKTLCEIGRKQQALENNRHSLNFNDLRYYLTSKLNNKLNDNNLKQTLHQRLQLLSLNQLFCSDSLSSICSTSSTSSPTNASPVDGNNLLTEQIESSNVTSVRNRTNHRCNQNNYYKRLKTKVFSFVEKQSESQINRKQTDSKQSSIRNGKPPAPPPRPLTVSSISETNRAKQLNESIEAKQKVNQSIYYTNYRNNQISEDKELESDNQYLEMNSQLALKQSHQQNNDNKLKICSNVYRIIKSNSDSESESHEYMNVCTKRNESPVLSKRDPLIDYDLVPSGIPVPINSLRVKAILSTKPPKISSEVESDYDIPKVPKIRRINNNIKDQIKGNDFHTKQQKQESTLETELQIFV